jgi:hypothetical protein
MSKELICPHCGESFVQKLAHKLEDDMWAGSAAFVLGGGPSLNAHGDTLYEIEKYGYVVATNRAIELPVRIDVWAWMEDQVFRWVRDGKVGQAAQERFLKFDGVYAARKLKSRNVLYPHYVTEIDYTSDRMLGGSFRTKVNTHTNVGFFGMNLAWCLGANPIILIGYDQKGNADNVNEWYHDGWPKKPTPNANRVYDIMRSGFENAARQAEEAGRQIWNASPNTALDCFPVFESLTEVFERLGTTALQEAMT